MSIAPKMLACSGGCEQLSYGLEFQFVNNLNNLSLRWLLTPASYIENQG